MSIDFKNPISELLTDKEDATINMIHYLTKIFFRKYLENQDDIIYIKYNEFIDNPDYDDLHKTNITTKQANKIIDVIKKYNPNFDIIIKNRSEDYSEDYYYNFEFNVNYSYFVLNSEKNTIKLKVGIVGTRENFNQYSYFKLYINKYIKNHIEELYSYSGKIIKITIISGGATGIDSLAERYAKDKGFDLKVYKAEWNKYGKSAGPIRNTQIIEDSDILIAFPIKSSKGTFDSINKAEKKGIPVYKHDLTEVLERKEREKNK